MRERRIFAERAKVLKSDEAVKNIFLYMRDRTRRQYILMRFNLCVMILE